jgi:hypothetical protein
MRYRREVKRLFVILGALAALAVPPIAVDAAPPHRTLSIAANPRPVVFGRNTVISGKLTGQNHDNKNVTIHADRYPFEGNFVNVGQGATTNAGGQYALTLKPLVNTRYRARQGSTQSSVLGVLVRIRVSFYLSDSTPESGQRVRFYGRACPQHDGALVRFQKRSRTGLWYTVRTTVLKDIPGSTCSRYSKRFRVYRDGTWRVTVKSDGDHARGISGRRRIDAHF